MLIEKINKQGGYPPSPILIQGSHPPSPGSDRCSPCAAACYKTERVFSSWESNSPLFSPEPRKEWSCSLLPSSHSSLSEDSSTALPPFSAFFLNQIREKATTDVAHILKNHPKLANLPPPSTPPLQTAIDSASDKMTMTLIDAGALVPNGFELFYYACQFGLVKTVKKLIKEKLAFNLNEKNARGYTPLHATLLMESAETHTQRLAVARLLILEAPQTIDIPDNQGCTALHIAAKLGECAFIELFVEGGARLEQTDPQGCSPLALAIYCGQIEAAALLVRKGANLKKVSDVDPVINSLYSDLLS